MLLGLDFFSVAILPRKIALAFHNVVILLNMLSFVPFPSCSLCTKIRHLAAIRLVAIFSTLDFSLSLSIFLFFPFFFLFFLCFSLFFSFFPIFSCFFLFLSFSLICLFLAPLASLSYLIRFFSPSLTSSRPPFLDHNSNSLEIASGLRDEWFDINQHDSFFFPHKNHLKTQGNRNTYPTKNRTAKKKSRTIQCRLCVMKSNSDD